MTTDASPAELEAAEISGYRDLWAAAPAALAARYGLAQAEVAGVHCTIATAMPGMRLLNHALGLGDDPEPQTALVAVERFFGGHGVPALVAVPDVSGAQDALVARGYVRDYAWVKFARCADPPSPVECPLAVRAVEPTDAERMGELIASGFGLPSDMAAWFAALVERAAWHCVGAYEGSQLVACGALYVAGDTGWLTWAATDPPHRGRGAQKALLAARLSAARELGLATLVTETGEPEASRPDALYRNIVAAGFQPVFRRPFWRSPSHARVASGEDVHVHPTEEEK